MDNEQPPTDHLSQQGLNNNTNKQILNSRSSKDKVVNNGYKEIGTEGDYIILMKDKKKYLKHKYKDEPIKDY